MVEADVVPDDAPWQAVQDGTGSHDRIAVEQPSLRLMFRRRPAYCGSSYPVR